MELEASVRWEVQSEFYVLGNVPRLGLPSLRGGALAFLGSLGHLGIFLAGT